MNVALIQAVAEAESNADIGAIVLTGAGRGFCAGAHLDDLLGAQNAEELAAIYTGFLAVAHSTLPTIAAVNGAAVGAGCDLACMCDIRIGSEKARFAESFAKLGIISGDGGAYLLPKLVGMSKAAEMTFTGDMIGAEEALTIGLISKVVPHETLMDEAHILAGKIAANPGHSLRMSKKLLREGVHSRLETVLEMAAAFQALAHHTDEHDVAVNALIAAMEKK